jgi:hypothetical protein
MNECNFTTLQVSHIGYVIHSRCCGVYQLAFGNIQLQLCVEEFMALKDYVAVKQMQLGASTDRAKKNNYISTDSQRVTMLLSADELGQLNELLQQAWLKQMINESIKNMN